MLTDNFLKTPIEAIVFDCDGTLSHIEGIDELAKARNVYSEVAHLTAEAMEQVGITPELYQKRLDLVYPSLETVFNLGQKYFDHRAPDSVEVIELLLSLGKTLYIVSAGLYPAVAVFGELLNIPKENIYAVDVDFDNQGNYRDFDHGSPLIQPDGKRTIIKLLQKQHPSLLYVGDGMNDYSVYDLVTRFVGYGGAFYREKFAKQSEYYIVTPTFKSLLPLALTKEEFEQICQQDSSLIQY